MIILADQSTWNGGILRWMAVQKEFSDAELRYYVHDMDAPWVQCGGAPRIINGWPKPAYWSLAARYPWSLETINADFLAARAALGSPRGLAYLAGPRTSETILSLGNKSFLNELIADLLWEEVRWARIIADLLDIRHPEMEFEFPSNIWDLSQYLADLSAKKMGIKSCTQVGSLVKLFGKKPPLLLGVLPNKYFWLISSNGLREEYDGRKKLGPGDILVPKGFAIPLEISAKGWTIGVQGIKYADQVRRLRDTYAPGLKIKVLEVRFDWQLYVDPIAALLERFLEKKRKRMRKKGIRDYKLPSFPQEIVDEIRSYWSQWPTSISWLILGGELNPTIKEVEI